MLVVKVQEPALVPLREPVSSSAAFPKIFKENALYIS